MEIFVLKICDKISAVLIIKHVSTIVNKVKNRYVFIRIFDLIDKWRYVFYGYDGRKFVDYYIFKCKYFQSAYIHIVHKTSLSKALFVR
jgi:hypothetical protein